jgi:diguanylate cyclase (GGDEF)-like protein
MLCFDEHEIAHQASEWFGRVHRDDVDQLKSDLQLHLEGLTPHFENEHRILAQDGTYRWMLSRGLAVRDSAGNATRIAGSQTDVTDRKLAFEQLTHDAFHDSLTELPNRALFMDRLERSLRNAKRHPEQLFAVLFLDLDRFKVINDSLGHLIGDQMLIAVAQRLKMTLRSIDTVARVGGDEFAILLENMDSATDAARVARRIHEELSVPFEIGEDEMYTTVSIGIALSTTGYERPQDMLRDADIAMYRAKSQGKARHEVFDKAMHEHAVRLLQVETDLRRALEREELSLHYQPVVSLETGLITGFEALLRWNRSDRLISASELIPIAEETGLILPIGQWVLREACRQMEMWHRRFPSQRPLIVHVNLSPKQFLQPSLVDSIQQILLETGLDPRSLNLEVTETVVVENAESAAALLSQLRAMRIQLALDDFGQGYSSLSTLHRYPFHMLKIDRSFIIDMVENQRNFEFVRAIANFARILGMEVVVEGVETAEQMARVRTLGIGQAQGYYFSKPLPPDAANDLLNAEPRWSTTATAK